MSDVVIYTRPGCGYCMRAIMLLDSKKIPYTEHEAGFDREKKQEMMTRSGRSTFPQIFIDGRHIGGSDELLALEREGKLDDLLAA
ncbi:MAG: glutaredoxin 3 [Caulobacteraceae bacterium]